MPLNIVNEEDGRTLTDPGLSSEYDTWSRWTPAQAQHRLECFQVARAHKNLLGNGTGQFEAMVIVTDVNNIELVTTLAPLLGKVLPGTGSYEIKHIESTHT